MSDRQLSDQGATYREASRVFDYFVTGLSSLLFVFAALFASLSSLQTMAGYLNLAAAAVFAMASVAGLKKLEYSLAILGVEYSIEMTEGYQSDMTVRETTAVLRDLAETSERLANRASIVHGLRNWLLTTGVVTVIVSLAFQLRAG